MSRGQKRQLILYQADDSEAVSRHLSKMAGKGWLLESVDNWNYTYRRSSPAELQYAVAFYLEGGDAVPGQMGRIAQALRP